MKSFFRLTSVLIIVAIINTGCPRKSCIEVTYAFNVQSEIIPNDDSLQIGDTIFVMSTFPNMLKDEYSGQLVDYSGALKIGSTLGIGELIAGSNSPKDAVSDFDYFDVEGRIYNDPTIPSPNGVQQLIYQEIDGKYKLKVGLIAKKKGIYVLGAGDGLGTGLKGSNNCKKAKIGMSVSNVDKHKYYYEYWRPGYVLTESDLRRIYCFKIY